MFFHASKYRGSLFEVGGTRWLVELEMRMTCMTAPELPCLPLEDFSKWAPRIQICTVKLLLPKFLGLHFKFNCLSLQTVLLLICGLRWQSLAYACSRIAAKEWKQWDLSNFAGVCKNLGGCSQTCMGVQGVLAVLNLAFPERSCWNWFCWPWAGECRLDLAVGGSSCSKA